MPPTLGPTLARPFLANEEIIFRIRQSAVLLTLQLVILGLVAVVLVVLLRQLGDSGPILGSLTLANLGTIAAVAAPGLVALVRVLDYFTTAYTLTNRRVQTDFGIFRRTSYAIPLTQVETLDINRSLGGRLLGYGDVVARPTAAVPIVITFRTISHPTLRREQIEEQLP